MSYIPPMTFGEVLYSNVFFDNLSTLSYNGTEVSGFGSTNAVDWRDFSIFTAQATKVLSVTIPTLVNADSFIVWPVGDGVTGTVILKNNSGTTISTATIDGTGKMVWNNISATLPAGTVSLTFSAAFNIRLVAVGGKLIFPMGQWADVNPPLFTQGLIGENLISVNGSIIARNIRRTEKTGKIMLDHLTQTWVRIYWEPFQAHAARYAFFHRWNPATYPNDIAFSVAGDIIPPKNTRAQFMSVEMPTKFITSGYP